MSVEIWIGIALTMLAGMMAGNCMLPSKFVKRWNWENLWLVFTLVSLVIGPWTLALWKIPGIIDLYSDMPGEKFILPLVFGFGWGIAQILFGLSVARLGMALSYAVIIGLGSLLGTLVPLVFQRREVLQTGKGVLILAGLTVMICGILVSGRAGRLREASAGASAKASGYAGALVLAVLCGLMAPMLNYSFAFGQGFAEEAIRRGVAPADAGYAVWPVGLTGGLIPNIGYAIYLIARNKTHGAFRPVQPDVIFPVLMGILWMGSMAVYGVAAVYLGALGTSVGWALFQIFMIMTANLSGVLTGEWRLAGRQALRILSTGLALLAAATVVISLGNSL